MTKQGYSTIDQDHLNQLADTVGAENLPTVLEVVLETTPRTLDELRGACADGDMPRAGRAAHKLKSECAYIGATSLASEAARIEKLAREGRSAEVADILSSIQLQVEAFLDDVRCISQNPPL